MNPVTEMLETEYNRRLMLNPAYSRRAFARDLDIPQSSLVNLLSGRTGISIDRAQKLCRKLGVEGSQKFYILDYVRGVSKAKRKTIKAKDHTSTKSNFKRTPIDEFSKVSDWYFNSILEYLSLDVPPATVAALAKVLNLQVSTVVSAIKKLVDLGELIKIKNSEQRITGRTLTSEFTVQEENVGAGNELPSLAIRNYQKQILNRAMRAIDTQGTEDRYCGSMLFGIEESQIPELKRRINQLFEDISQRDRGHKKPTDRVYVLSAQLFNQEIKS